MKKFLLLFAVVCFAITATAQSEKYVAAMKKNMQLLDSAKSPDDLQNAANNFERISTVEKDQWQPYYYAAYSLIMKCFFSKDRSAIDAVVDKADEMLAMAESLSPNNSEITTLKSMALTARMQVDNSRGMTLGPKSAMLLQEAMKQQPADNPRTLMQMAQSKYYTPPAFGGGKDQALELIKKSVSAYESFKPATDLDPTWGKEYAESLLAQWSK